MARTKQLGQDIRDRTTMAGQPGHDSRNMIGVSGQLGQLAVDRLVWIRNKKTHWLEPDRKDRTAWKGQSHQDNLFEQPDKVSRGKIVRTGHLKQIREDRLSDRSA
jgi:hypothetical protein